MSAMTITTKATGGFAPIAKALPTNAKNLVLDTATVLQAIDTALCPVDTGELKASIHQEQKGPYTVDVVEGTGLPDARALFTEYGTHHATYSIAAQPHQTPAAAHAWQTEMSRRLPRLLKP